MFSPSNARLSSLLASIVASVATSACGSDCPQTVIDRDAKVSVPLVDACREIGKLNVTKPLADVCHSLCGDTATTTCEWPRALGGLYQSDDGGASDRCKSPAATDAVEVRCLVTHREGTAHAGCPVAGRRTSGIDETTQIGSGGLGHYFAQCAELEAISVHAFRRLARELRAIGAPEELVARATRAAADEVAHASAMRKLALRFGVAAPRVAPRTLPLRDRYAVALENAVEGVVRETFGAAVALYEANAAGDRSVRAVRERIAVDERAHAELALDLERYFTSVLSEHEIAAIERAKRAAVAELRRASEAPISFALQRVAGLPSAAAARMIVDELDRRVWTQRRAA